ncbi:hypothetical protein [Ammoniphilus resinae]|uniref:Peptidylprolyl isomerase n=1 Tax=Ammoniphilus resinae TaxID=861532 RepID=A0ABS4GQB2_9BACL|nr:hypothetical protein [Ammoniphilus resinae]MBP1932458.1 hypothetical protein [Ammoniphilus resinae]
MYRLKKMSIGLLVLMLGITVITTACSKVEGSETAVATVNGEGITKEDLSFYRLINLLQIALYREADQQRYQGEELKEANRFWDQQEQAVENQNTLLTQIIRLRAAALLAKEKGYTVKEEEIQKEIEKIKAYYAQHLVAKDMIAKYGEIEFWKQQELQYERILLAGRVQQDMVERVKQANPKAESKEIQMLAEKKYEELLVSQISTLDIQLDKR